MTSTQMLSPTVTALASAAAEITAALPELNGWTVEPVIGRADQPPAAEAVVADVGGLGRVVLAVAGTLARAVQAGPPPIDDVVEALRETVLSTVESLGRALGESLTATELRAVSADMAMLPGRDEIVEAVRLLDGEMHLATLAVVRGAAAPEVGAMTFPAVEPHGARTAGHPLELLNDVELGVTVELGRTRMLLRDVLALVPGSVIELDRAAGSPVDLLVNNTLIARGEVVVIDEEFGIRITEVLGTADAVRAL